jgi:prepilin-type N-terminal cleavage/methylation domain-containing protein
VGGGSRSAGYTLIELLVAMALFSVLGIALVSLLAQSTAFLEKGTAGSEVLDTIENADRAFYDDFANVYTRPASPEGMPDVRFVCDRLSFDSDGDGTADVWTPRLTFVRSVTGEASEPATREAGTKAGASGRMDGKDDAKEREDQDFAPAGGKQEVCWILLGPKKGEDLALGTLYRRVNWPVGGGSASLQPQEPVKEPKGPNDRQGITNRDEITSRMFPVLGGVLHLSYRFWSRHTKPESARLVVNSRLADEVRPEVGGGGLSSTWDSTRGILPLGVGPEQFFLAKPGTSLLDPVDDLFPSRVRVTLVVDRIGKDAATGELVRNVGVEDSTIPVDTTKFAAGVDPAGRFIKIDREWIQWSSKDARTFTVEKRGARGTKKEPHGSGSVVRAGTTLVREYAIPSHREDWND